MSADELRNSISELDAQIETNQKNIEVLEKERLEKERLIKEVLEKRIIIAEQNTQLQALQEEKENKSSKDSPQR